MFLYGFAKSERDDLDDDELRELKRLARSDLALSEETIDRLIDDGKLIEVRNGEPEAS